MTSIARDGFEILSDLIDCTTADALIDATASATAGDVRHRAGRVYAMRNLLDVSCIRELADSEPVRAIVERTLGSRARAVRGIFFDKTPGANWKVAWHQDLSIAVKRRVEIDGYGPWSRKAGVAHVQPPREILEAMLTVRLHLDDCGEENGPLKVVAGSHGQGVLSPTEVDEAVRRGPVVKCAVPRGGAVLMRPLTLHASSPARSPSHRRVIHLEFCGRSLPEGLEWAFASQETEEAKK